MNRLKIEYLPTGGLQPVGRNARTQIRRFCADDQQAAWTWQPEVNPALC